MLKYYFQVAQFYFQARVLEWGAITFSIGIHMSPPP